MLALLFLEPLFNITSKKFLRALTMQDSITESKTINYILFMVFC